MAFLLVASTAVLALPMNEDEDMFDEEPMFAASKLPVVPRGQTNRQVRVGAPPKATSEAECAEGDKKVKCPGCGKCGGHK